MESQTLYKFVARIVFEVCRHEVRHEDLKTPLANLEIDSVELMEVFGVLEEELGIRLKDDEIAEVHTFEDLLFLLGSHDCHDRSSI